MEITIPEWISLENEVIYNRRYFSKHHVLEKLKIFFEKTKLQLPIETNIYRARIIEGEDEHKQFEVIRNERRKYISEIYGASYDSKSKEEKDEIWKNIEVQGYNPSNSGAPPADSISAGRANLKYIPVFYAAKEEITSLKECRPNITDLLSIATYKPCKNLTIANICTDQNYYNDKFIYDTSITLTISFSKLVKEKGDKHYIFTQFLSEYIKSLGYDGMCFESSLHKNGINYVLYDVNCCHFIRSDTFIVNDITIDTRKVGHNY